jgi:lysosomal-associated membrane protein 1/2
MEPTTQGPTDSPSSQGPQTKWEVKDPSTGIVCILAQFRIELYVQYNATNQDDKNMTYLANSSFEVPQSAKVVEDGSYCSASTVDANQQIKLQFGAYNHNVTVQFSQDNVTHVKQIAFEYDLRDATVFPNATPGIALQRAFTYTTQTLVPSIPKAQYFVCYSGGPLTLNNPEEKLNTIATVTEITVEAFRDSTDDNFDGGETHCPWDPTTSPATSPLPTTTEKPMNAATYKVVNGSGALCFYAQFGLSVNLQYKDVNGTVQKGDIIDVNNGTVDMQSSCGENETTLVISKWIPDWVLHLDFSRKDNTFSLTTVTLDFNLKPSSAVQNADDTSNHTSVTQNVNKWTASVGHSYMCQASDTWNLNITHIDVLTELHLVLQNIQVQAFMTGNATNPQFGEAEKCADPTSDIVPIAVGCALAALVVIVLIAYVIGRRRNRARGYESM